MNIMRQREKRKTEPWRYRHAGHNPLLVKYSIGRSRGPVDRLHRKFIRFMAKRPWRIAWYTLTEYWRVGIALAWLGKDSFLMTSPPRSSSGVGKSSAFPRHRPSGVRVMLTSHAIDRASTRFLDQYIETRKNGQGIYDWTYRMAMLALKNQPRVAGGENTFEYKTHGMVFIVKFLRYGGVAVVRTVIKPDEEYRK